MVFVAELGVGLLTGSLALLADSGHVLLDVAALALAYVGARWAGRRPDERYTYGYRRAEVIVAAVNGLFLFLLVGFVVAEAVDRLRTPKEVWVGPMMAMAGAGLLGNLAMAALLGHHDADDLSMRAAFLHVLGDALGSLAVVLGGASMILTGQTWPDAAASLLISGILLVGAIRVLRRAGRVLAEGVPEGLVLGEVARAMAEVGGVREVHDLHVWSLGPGSPALTAHVVLGERSLQEADAIVAELRRILKERFGIHHVTIQVESGACQAPCCNALKGG